MHYFLLCYFLFSVYMWYPIWVFILYVVSNLGNRDYQNLKRKFWVPENSGFIPFLRNLASNSHYQISQPDFPDLL